MYTTSSARWQATSTRAPASSTAFVYAVRTTRIFCRPTCKARLARRSNVTFYDTAAEAQAAGFRACKRCKPLLEGEWEPERERIRRVCAVLGEEGKSGLTLGEMAREAGLMGGEGEWGWREGGGGGGDGDGNGDGDRDEDSGLGGDDEEVGGKGKREKQVCYTTIPTAHGALLVAFLRGRICKLDLLASEREARGVLAEAFCCDDFGFRALGGEECAGFEGDVEMILVAEQIAEAVERPSGRMLSLELAEGGLEGLGLEMEMGGL
ncbi:hypothetical protein Q7P37_001119 [Cladosporium fusiforme]